MEREYVAEWFTYADRDLTVAEHLQGMRPQPLEIICFLCQQSAEKYIKGYLISKGITEPPKTHNLSLLIDMCLEYDERFTAIKRACGNLNRYGVQPRYPNEIRITENDMPKALEYARQVRDFELMAAVRKEVG